MSEQNIPAQASEIDIEMTAEIVSAYVSNNPVPASELPNLIASIHASLKALGTNPIEPVEEPEAPAVNPRKSVHNDYIICLEDGKKFKSLKRHLSTHYNMTPDEYRTKWNLPRDYPMVAPSYAAARSEMAKKMGLGKKVVEAVEVAAPKKRSRRKGAE